MVSSVTIGQVTQMAQSLDFLDMYTYHARWLVICTTRDCLEVAKSAQKDLNLESLAVFTVLEEYNVKTLAQITEVNTVFKIRCLIS